MSGGWNTIESDAGVFTYLLENLGVKGVQFEELLTLDPDDLAALQPIYGVIFLFRFPTKAAPDSGAPRDGTFDTEAASEIFFAHQTIQNACGTQALLSVLLNHGKEGEGEEEGEDGENKVELGSHLASFREFAMALPPDLRGEALSNDERIRDVHNAFAKSSPFVDETQRPDPGDDPDVFHFIAYTAVRGRLYELDGLQPAPIDHGPCASADAFPAAVVPVLQRRIARYGSDEIHFNLLAAVQDRRIVARKTGDVDLLAREARKRRDWQFENALRRHNFVGFAHEVLEGVVEDKLQKGRSQEHSSGDNDNGNDKDRYYKSWVQDATKSYEDRLNLARKRRGLHKGGDKMDVDQ